MSSSTHRRLRAQSGSSRAPDTPDIQTPTHQRAAKTHYGTSLANVDWLHGGAESLLTITNLFIVLGLRQAIRAAEQQQQQQGGADAAAAAAERRDE